MQLYKLKWLESQGVMCQALLSANRDILLHEVPSLIKNYHAVAADWESGAIAWAAQFNQVPVDDPAQRPIWWESKVGRPTGT